MKTKFLNLPNLKYALQSLPLKNTKVVESLESCFSQFNNKTGIIDEIIQWNIKFRDDPTSHPLSISRDENGLLASRDNPWPWENFTEKWKDKVKGRIGFSVHSMTNSDFSRLMKGRENQIANLENMGPKGKSATVCYVQEYLEELGRSPVVFFHAPISLDGSDNLSESVWSNSDTYIYYRIEVPLRILLRGSPDLNKTYTVYLHTLVTDTDEMFNYYGLTKRGWNIRFNEHWREGARNYKTRRLFPLKVRSLIQSNMARKNGGLNGGAKLKHINTVLCTNGASQNHAMNAEEYLVDKYSLNSKHPNGLNMIPGGYAGIKALHKLRGENPNKNNQFMSTEQRERLLDEYLLKNPRVGVPNPGAAEKWKDDAYAEAVICGPENRLNPDQVRETRYLSATGLEPDVILQKVGALNLRQVEGVLSGKHYSRIT